MIDIKISASINSLICINQLAKTIWAAAFCGSFLYNIKHAFIAEHSRREAGGIILVNLSKQDDNYSIDIYDNGVEFDVDTLSKIGLERAATHADSGGSGIGFMMTFETLKKAYASLIITEFESQAPFSKSVTFRFDGENAYIIHSYRSEELKKNINRADLVIDN